MSGRVYCGRLSSTATEKDLEALLKTCGKVRHIDFKEGYAYAVFKDYHDADKAVNELNGKAFLGESILVERAKQARNGIGGYFMPGGVSSRNRQPKAPPLRTEHRLRVENLSTRAKWLELKEHMVSAGDVTFADAHRRRPGVGLVEYATREEMLTALKTLDDTEFYGKRISLVEEKALGDRAQSRSRSQSRSRNRKRRPHSRSRSRTRSRTRSRSRGHKSRSRSPRKSRSRRRSRSKHRSNSSRPHHNSKSSSHYHRRSRSHSRSRHHSNSLDKSKSRSRQNSHSPVKSHKKSRKSKVRSKSRSNSPKTR